MDIDTGESSHAGTQGARKGRLAPGAGRGACSAGGAFPAGGAFSSGSTPGAHAGGAPAGRAQPGGAVRRPDQGDSPRPIQPHYGGDGGQPSCTAQCDITDNFDEVELGFGADTRHDDEDDWMELLGLPFDNLDSGKSPPPSAGPAASAPRPPFKRFNLAVNRDLIAPVSIAVIWLCNFLGLPLPSHFLPPATKQKMEDERKAAEKKKKAQPKRKRTDGSEARAHSRKPRVDHGPGVLLG